jgi:hypothetical protein
LPKDAEIIREIQNGKELNEEIKQINERENDQRKMKDKEQAKKKG